MHARYLSLEDADDKQSKFSKRIANEFKNLNKGIQSVEIILKAEYFH